MNYLENISFLALWAIIGASIMLRFLLFSFGGYAWFYLRKRNPIEKKIQSNVPSFNMLKFEIKQSVHNLLLLGVLSSVVLFLFRSDYNQLYFEISEFGWVYFLVSIFLMMLIHDTWFYWLHRLIHLPSFFSKVHATHHKSANPTPFSSFSMNWSEMILEFAIFPMIVFVLPMHPVAFTIFVFISFVFNIMGHLGYEIFNQKFLNSFIGKGINTSTKHNLHHELGRYNYGYYFTFWDRLMGTEYNK